jgi:hypothetical protein
MSADVRFTPNSGHSRGYGRNVRFGSLADHIAREKKAALEGDLYR